VALGDSAVPLANPMAIADYIVALFVLDRTRTFHAAVLALVAQVAGAGSEQRVARSTAIARGFPFFHTWAHATTRNTIVTWLTTAYGGTVFLAVVAALVHSVVLLVPLRDPIPTTDFLGSLPRAFLATDLAKKALEADAFVASGSVADPSLTMRAALVVTARCGVELLLLGDTSPAEDVKVQRYTEWTEPHFCLDKESPRESLNRQVDSEAGKLALKIVGNNQR
jgi:hypothetical protein